MRQTLLCIVILFVALNTKAQTTNDFQATGEPTARIYSNFHTGLTAGDDNAVFEIERAYLGYSYNMSPVFSASILLDIGSPEDESVYAMVKRFAYFKNAYIRYAKNKLDVRFGIVGMNHFKVQESFWGYRYIEKSFADRYKFGKSADLGIIAQYEINPQLTVDAAIVNGEGYSQLQTDNYFEYTAGLTLSAPEKLTWRFFANYGPSDGRTKMVYAAFLGYKPTKNLSIAAEYNILQNYKYLENRNQSGYSFYSTYALKNNWKIFGRYDILESNALDGTTTPWNLAKDGTSIIAGVEKKLHKNLKISLNYRDWFPSAANIDNEAYLYFNVEFKL
ncbi:MAG TPA: outer membrane beta-barrel protein [Prolixibacteraceae bacterium]|nr:outer membrane beta-barrel protein [Prolixibacteraceae bacterium]